MVSEAEVREHATNIGLIVLELHNHKLGHLGDCSINDPILTVIDRCQPSHKLVEYLANMPVETAAGIVDQLTAPTPSNNVHAND